MEDFKAEFERLRTKAPVATPFIDGSRQSLGSAIHVVDPATGDIWGKTLVSTEAAESALASSTRAFASDAWRLLTADARAALMEKLAVLIEQNATELALYETLASGKTVAATVPEIGALPIWYKYYAGLATFLDGDLRRLSASAEAKIVREPLGVIVAITPFNAPLSLGSWKIAPALAAGNTVIVKPPVEAAFSTVRLAELAIEAGFPPGVINVVPGGADVAMQLVNDPRIHGVSLTGSSAAARAVGAAAAGRLKHFSAEAGGKSAHIIFEDADLDNAVIAATQGAFSATGQTCVAGSRLLVHQDVKNAFVDKYLKKIAGLRVGDPLSAESNIGPLAAHRHEERVAGFVERAVSVGGEALIGGGRPKDLEPQFERGSWFAPTILDNVTSDMEIFREEVFGPVATITAFETEEEAVALANGVEYGLAAGFWTSDAGRIHRVSQALQAGTIWVNTYRMIHWRVPFGGVKQSGIGRENGPDALEQFTQVKSIVVDHGPAKDPFAS